MQNTFTRIHKVLTSFIGLAVFVQFFLAGLWHAEVLPDPEAHVFFGLGLLLASLMAFLAALAGRMDRRAIRTTGLLFLLILLQPILIEQRRSGIPLLSAFHTLNAAFIGVVAGMLARMPASLAEKKDMVQGAITPATAGD